jgi:hypothetical protein
MAGVALLEVLLGFLYNVTHSRDNLLFVGYFEFEKMFPMTGDDSGLRGRGWKINIITCCRCHSSCRVE